MPLSRPGVTRPGVGARSRQSCGNHVFFAMLFLLKERPVKNPIHAIAGTSQGQKEDKSRIMSPQRLRAIALMQSILMLSEYRQIFRIFGLQMIRANRPVRSRIYLAKIHPTYVSRCLSPRTAIYMRRTATLSPRNPSSNEIRSEEH